MDGRTIAECCELWGCCVTKLQHTHVEEQTKKTLGVQNHPDSSTQNACGQFRVWKLYWQTTCFQIRDKGTIALKKPPSGTTLRKQVPECFEPAKSHMLRGFFPHQHPSWYYPSNNMQPPGCLLWESSPWFLNPTQQPELELPVNFIQWPAVASLFPAELHALKAVGKTWDSSSQNTVNQISGGVSFHFSSSEVNAEHNFYIHKTWWIFN